MFMYLFEFKKILSVPKTYKIFLLSLGFVFFLEAHAANVKIAFFDLAPENNSAKSLSSVIPDLLEIGFSGANGVDVLERKNIRIILEEQNLSLSGLTGANILSAGKLIGADILCFGSASIDEKSIKVSLRLISTKSGEAVETLNVSGTRNNVNKLIKELLGQIVEKISTVSGTKAAIEIRKMELAQNQILEHFTQASSSKESFYSLINELKNSLSLDPNYNLSRNRITMLKKIPQKIFIPANSIFMNRILTSIRQNKKFAKCKFCFRDESTGKIVIDSISFKDLSLPIYNTYYTKDKKLHLFDAPRYFYDAKTNRILVSRILRYKETEDIGKCLGQVFDLVKKNKLIEYEIEYRPSLYTSTLSDGMYYFHLMFLGNNGIDIGIFDIMSGKKISTIETRKKYPTSFSILNSKDAWIALADSKSGLNKYKFENIFDKNKSIYLPGNIDTRFNDIDSIQAKANGFNICARTYNLFSVFNVPSSSWICSRNDIRGDVYTASRNRIFGDDRVYFITNDGISIIREDIIAPPLVFNITGMADCADFDGDGKSEFFIDGNLYKLAETENILPQENMLISTWVYTESPYAGLAMEDMKKSGSFSRAYDTAGDIPEMHNIVIPILRSCIADGTQLSVFDVFGLKDFLAKGMLIPEKDMDSYSVKRPYNLIKCRWYATLKIIPALDKTFTIKGSVLDSSKPMHKPVFECTEKGTDIADTALKAALKIKKFIKSQNQIKTVSQIDQLPEKMPVIPVSITVPNIPQESMSPSAISSNPDAIAAILSQVFAENKKYTLLERAELKKLLMETTIKGDTKKDLSAPSVIVGGALLKFGKKENLLLRIYDADTAVIIYSDMIDISKGGLKTVLAKIPEKFYKEYINFQAHQKVLLTDIYMDYLKFKTSGNIFVPENEMIAGKAETKETIPVSEVYLSGEIKENLKINNKDGIHIIKTPLKVKKGTKVVLEEDSKLIISNEIVFEEGSMLYLEPGARIILKKSGPVNPCLKIKGCFIAEGSKTKKINVTTDGTDIYFYVTVNAQKVPFSLSDDVTTMKNNSYETIINNVCFDANINLQIQTKNNLKMSGCDFHKSSRLRISPYSYDGGWEDDIQVDIKDSSIGSVYKFV